MNYLEKAFDVIKEFEGFRSYPYKCPAGIWTIGWGTTMYPNGKLVSPTDRSITREEANSYLNHRVQKDILGTLSKIVPNWSSLSDGQKAALISFAYNLGPYFYGSQNFQTLTKALSKKENWKDVPKALMLYVNPGTAFEQGLKRRRLAEAKLWQESGHSSSKGV